MEFQRPADIERESMRIISGELEERGIALSGEVSAVIRRIIHTTADFEYAETVRISDQAVRKGIEALQKGAVIVTDTNMALAGISKKGLAGLGGNAVCLMADPEIALEAKKREITRAVVSMERAASRYPGCILAVGNAPTALFEIENQIRKGFRPALVIAVPVGFVNVTEAKEAVWNTCVEYSVPVIAAMGRKGGSTVAAAICNALIYQAADLTDPDSRN